MAQAHAPTTDPIVGRDPQQATATAQAIALQLDHPGGKSHFWRHFWEMNAAMFLGMVAGGLVVSGILAAFGTTPNQARLHYPELAVLVMAFNMTVPMVAWMRHRGHGWRSSGEMAAAMLVPAVPVIALLRSHIIVFGAVCGLYCASMIVAMLALMLYRRNEYAMH